MTLDKVIPIIARAAKCQPDDVKPESELVALGLSSLDTITVLFELEETFDIDIPNEIITSIVTVGDVVDKLDELMHQS
jgi:acyl carrier protein